MNAAVGRGFTVMVVVAAGNEAAAQLLLFSAVMVNVVVAVSAPVGMENVLPVMESAGFVTPPSVEYVPVKPVPPESVPVSVWLVPEHTGVVGAVKLAVGCGFTVTVVVAAGKLVAAQKLSLSAEIVKVEVVVSEPVAMLNVLPVMESVCAAPPLIWYCPVKGAVPVNVPVSV